MVIFPSGIGRERGEAKRGFSGARGVSQTWKRRPQDACPEVEKRWQWMAGPASTSALVNDFRSGYNFSGGEKVLTANILFFDTVVVLLYSRGGELTGKPAPGVQETFA